MTSFRKSIAAIDVESFCLDAPLFVGEGIAVGKVARAGREDGRDAVVRESVLSECGTMKALQLLMSDTSGVDRLNTSATALVRGVNSARSPAGVCGATMLSAPPEDTFAIVTAVRGVTGATSMLPPFFRSARMFTNFSAVSACSHESICGRCLVRISFAVGRSRKFFCQQAVISVRSGSGISYGMGGRSLRWRQRSIRDTNGAQMSAHGSCRVHISHILWFKINK